MDIGNVCWTTLIVVLSFIFFVIYLCVDLNIKYIYTWKCWQKKKKKHNKRNIVIN